MSTKRISLSSRYKLFFMSEHTAQAATVGLLFCMLCAQSQYALGDLDF